MSNTLKERELVDFITRSLVKKGTTIVVTPETLLFKEHVLDSMNILDLIGYVEKNMGRKLKDEEIVMDNFQSACAMIKAFSNG